MPATEKYLRNINRMHVVFCIASVAFAAATLTMLLRDHQDEWRVWQTRFSEIESALARDDKVAAFSAAGGEAAYKEKLETLTQQSSQAASSLEAGNAEYTELKKATDKLEFEYDLIGRDVRTLRAQRDVARANYDLGIRDHLTGAPLESLKAKFDSLESEVRELEIALENKNQELLASQASLSKLTSERDGIEKELKALTSEVTRIDDVLSAIAPTGIKAVKKRLMEMPIIDGFNSPQRVIQDWMPDLKITLGMAKPARFDRCRTCHLGIDRFGNGNVPVFPHGDDVGQFPHPFSSHPRPDVYLTATSPHPLPSFGCTACHDGQGSATKFVNAQHGANDPHQDEQWAEKYGHFHDHFWEYPMLPERLREASCLKCHHEVVELGENPKFGATAPKAYEGWQLIRQFGCFGCHEINGFDGKKRIGPDIRLEPAPEEEPKYESDPNMIRGEMRKVGPGLKHVAQKTSQNWLAYWTADPKRFRPSTRMPQFFGLTNLKDPHGEALSQVEIAAISHYLTKQSTPVELESPAAGYTPDPERGAKFFAERGCLACHTHSDERFKGAVADFGPDLSSTHKKLLPGADGFNWLYTWIRDPQRHSPRSRMPNLFLDPVPGADGTVVDPAADIAAFLSSAGPEQYPALSPSPDAVRSLAEQYLSGKSLTAQGFEDFWKTRAYPFARDGIKGDEVELAGDAPADDAQWNDRLLSYLGRRSISRYGCYACHDINGFGTARPIGTALQDWGRKDPGRLAPEHIHEYLHESGEKDGSSTEAFVSESLKKAKAHAFDSPEEEVSALRRAFFYDSLIHHGRPGFIFQKLRDPRSYDFRKTETKKYVERLVMPQFPLNDDQMEAISTFVLGLVSDPPAERYVYNPPQTIKDRNRGEVLMRTYNCVGCHMTDMDRIEYGVEDGDMAATAADPALSAFARDALMALRKPADAYNGQTHREGTSTFPVVSLRGMVQMTPDPEEEDPEARQYTFMTWEPVRLNQPDGADGGLVLPSLQVIPETRIKAIKPASTGQFAKWLVQSRMPDGFAPKAFDTGWQSGPPPLFKEGEKVRTDWLYRFLKNPGQIRHTVTLRMPMFNISDAEAVTLSNYFAASDGVTYPYADASQTTPEYLVKASADFASRHADRAKAQPYMDESWQMLTTTLCIKCHAVGGRPFASAPNDPNVTRGPDLQNVSSRIRPEWLTVWLANPKWITPYTSMPLPFAANQKQYLPLFDGDGGDQTLGVRDALLNYHMLIERRAKPPELTSN